MRPKCVTCHNSHPQSPKRNWKTNDLAGVLEVSVPLIIAKQGNIGFFILNSTLLIIVLITSFSTIYFLMDKLKKKISNLRK